MLTLDEEIAEQIEKLAKGAGRRAAARRALRDVEVSEAELHEIERAETAAIKERLTMRFQESGELPPVLAELVDMLPKIDTGPDAPQITVIRCPCCTCSVGVERAQPTSINPVTLQGLAQAIRNALTSERR